MEVSYIVSSASANRETARSGGVWDAPEDASPNILLHDAVNSKMLLKCIRVA
jgi:hypothetical protein